MLNRIPNSGIPGDCFLGLELRQEIDGCNFVIRAERTALAAEVRWECCLCGKAADLPAHSGWSMDSLVIHGQIKASEHMMREHPGPETRAALDRLVF